MAEKRNHLDLYIWRSLKGAREWYWKLKAKSNGKITHSSSEGFKSYAGCVNNYKMLEVPIRKIRFVFLNGKKLPLQQAMKIIYTH